MQFAVRYLKPGDHAVVEETAEAGSAAELRARLMAAGGVVLDLKTAATASPTPRTGRFDVAWWCRELRTLLRAGMTAVEAIETLAASHKDAARDRVHGALLKSLREGDTFVVWRLDRLGRNLADLVRLIAELETRRIHFESLTEKIETRSPAGKLVFHVFAALAEFERNLIRERTVAGLKAARARGRKGGRPAKLSAKEIKTIRALLKTADIPVAEIAARFGIARSTLYRAVLNTAA